MSISFSHSHRDVLLAQCFENSAHDDDLNQISTITKRSLNKLCGSRRVSIQEAVFEIAGLDLVICSDYLTDVSLGRALYLRKDSSKSKDKKDLIDSYRNRDSTLDGLSLEDYFYEHFVSNDFYEDTTTKRKKHRILIPKGLNCRPRYPVDYDYAKGMLVMHKPWSVRNPLNDLLDDEEETIKSFLTMIEKNELPLTVLSEYNRAVVYSQQWRYECTSKQVSTAEDVNLDDFDNEQLSNHLHWEHCRHLSAQNTRNLDDHVAEMRVNLGIDHNWTKRYFEGERAPNLMAPEEYTKYLKDKYYGNVSTPIGKNIPSTRIFPTSSKITHLFL
jgi:hypothetical protein